MHLKWNSDRLVNVVKGSWSYKLACANKKESLSTPKNLALVAFDKLLIVFSLKVYLLYVLYLTDLRLYLLLLTKLNCLQKSSQRTISTISLPTSPSWINLKLHNIHVTPKLDQKAITNLDLLNKPGADCIPAVILMKCKLEILF